MPPPIRLFLSPAWLLRRRGRAARLRLHDDSLSFLAALRPRRVPRHPRAAPPPLRGSSAPRASPRFQREENARHLILRQNGSGSQKPPTAISGDSSRKKGKTSDLAADGSYVIEPYILILPFFARFMSKQLRNVTKMLRKTRFRRTNLLMRRTTLRNLPNVSNVIQI